jgi:hypothetical protein
VACQLVADNVNLYYYTLQDVQYGNPVPSFGIKPAGDLQTVNPLFDLSCPASAKPVSYLFPLALSSALSPLLFLLLYNLSIAWSMLQHLLPAVRCDCPCVNTIRSPVHVSTRAAKPNGWTARTNGHAKSSSTSSRTATLGRSSSIGLPTSEGDVAPLAISQRVLTCYSASKQLAHDTLAHVCDHLYKQQRPVFAEAIVN